MKTIKEGVNPYDKKWWHGKQAECDGCGKIVELEADDINLYSFEQSDFEIFFKCKNCYCAVFRVRKFDYKKSTFKRVFIE